MRIFDINQRISLHRDDVVLFTPELDFYRNHNQFPVILFGTKVTNIYRNINVQLVLTKKCGYKCPFCIENDAITSKADVDPNLNFESVLFQYNNQGINPCVSITGGEPTLFPDRLIKALELTKKFGIKRVNINTNGVNLTPIENLDGFRINLSRHHYDDKQIKEIFGYESKNHLLANRTVMQCVMMKGKIDSLIEMKKYMDYFIQLGAIGFSFRGLTKLDAGKDYDKEVNFSLAHAIDFAYIANQVAQDSDFQFIEQKIGDHYWFEIYKYKGKIVRLTYSNFEWLRQVERQERANGQLFSRATIVASDGNVYTGWTYDINKLFII